ncbi:uncharacterized protein LOC106156620 [Lingula anatina]|uniref:Uncharacterized protein LOC106156620 n=1 Tax=Lingula anatina TaxID=7574 RepID=A0A1S3HN07_LINAN|nr:uncharacterized protein LOC106156620 [Lingula anatina]|eukprot:XP_013387412.1 uncharacterized protein LOC106156620 [Lingula anatina]
MLGIHQTVIVQELMWPYAPGRRGFIIFIWNLRKTFANKEAGYKEGLIPAVRNASPLLEGRNLHSYKEETECDVHQGPQIRVRMNRNHGKVVPYAEVCLLFKFVARLTCKTG